MDGFEGLLTRQVLFGPSEITRIAVAGFKSIAEPSWIDIAPLTILAGANSSGKSSIMQPLLMLKQTLEVSYDPGALLLDGPSVKFTSVEQFLSRGAGPEAARGFSIALWDESWSTRTHYVRGEHGMEITHADATTDRAKFTLAPGMRSEEIVRAFTLPSSFEAGSEAREGAPFWEVTRSRCFLRTRVRLGPEGAGSFVPMSVIPDFSEVVSRVIHLPGLRRNAERSYPIAAVESEFPGTFDSYTASVIHRWQREAAQESLQALRADLRHLGLASNVATVLRDDAHLELRVGLAADQRDTKGLVDLADVGFGVSQALPVLVALLAAEPGQLVYLEEPEVHLHPRAQSALARPLLAAAARGVRIVLETHSSLLLLGIQTLVAEGAPADLVKLHWFTRDVDSGCTRITSSDLDELGRFETDWPEDFADVMMAAESRYLDAVERRQLARAD